MIDSLIFEKDNEGVATIILNRPEKLNALDIKTRMELPKVIEEIRQDDEIKVVILTGAGRGFCAGADVAAQKARVSGEKVEDTRRKMVEPASFWLLPLAKLEKPTIAAVNGVAIAIGLSLALVCDIRIASDHAKFGAYWIKRALVPDGGATYYLPKLIGYSRAIEFMYTGALIDAKEAERIGLVSRVIPHDELMAKVKELASQLARGPSVALEFTKKTVFADIHQGLEAHIYFESHALHMCRQTEDHKEAVEAFFQKRDPVFKGR